MRTRVQALQRAQEDAHRAGDVAVVPGPLWEEVAVLAYVNGWRPRQAEVLLDAAAIQDSGPVATSAREALGPADALGLASTSDPQGEGYADAAAAACADGRGVAALLASDGDLGSGLRDFAAKGGFDIY